MPGRYALLITINGGGIKGRNGRQISIVLTNVLIFTGSPQ